MSAENKNKLIVPVREPQALSSKKQEYGPLSWNPNYIPYGKNLFIDISSFLQLYQLLALRLEIELGNLSHQMEKSQPAIKPGAHEELAITSTQKSFFPKKHKKREVLTSQLGKAQINIDFIELANLVESETNLSKDEQEFWRLFSQRVNAELVGSFTSLILPNTTLVLDQNNVDNQLNLHYELIIFMIQIIFLLVISVIDATKEIYSTVTTGEVNPQSIVDIPIKLFVISIIVHEYLICMAMLLDFLTSKPTDEDANVFNQYTSYIRRELTHWNLLACLMPLQAYRTVLLPWAYIQFWRQPLVVDSQAYKEQLALSEFEDDD